MRHNDIIDLLSISSAGYDDIGNPIKTEVSRTVFANKMSITSSEFYNAALAGLRPAMMFEIYTAEYQGEKKLKYDNTTYNIIRVETKGDKTRLVCERVSANG